MSTAAVDHSQPHADPLGARFGMWLFLFTEMLLFGGLFLLYAVYRSRFGEDFHYAASGLSLRTGAFNTLVLLTSSLTMVLAVGAAERGRERAARGLLSATIGLGLLFLLIKAGEWSAKIHHGLYPNSEELVAHAPGENIFYGLYYAMTGLHALHVVAGIIVLLAMMTVGARRRGESRGLRATRIETAGLYWHLVDVIWIFLFPLFYLIS